MQDDESAVSHTRLAYLPALDGVRAFAVVAVMMFHGGIPHMDGGFMGVDAFFVLSGFLITSLLIGEWRQTLTIKLGAFWARRARRLLPALLLMLLFVAFFASVIVPKGTYGALRLDALSTLLYVSNWHFILVNSNYFAENGATASPLLHTWSLAVEEQFYLIWPLGRPRRAALHAQPQGPLRAVRCRGDRLCRLDVTRSTTAASTRTGPIWAPTPGRNACSSGARSPWASCSSRSAATSRAGWPRESCGARATRAGLTACGTLGIVGAAGAVSIWLLTTSLSSFPYSGGFFLLGLSVGAVIVATVAAPRSIVPRFLALTPIRYVGRISYGLYIWHWPIFIWLNHERTGLSGWQLFAVRVLVTFAVSVVSFHLVERPIRMGTFVSQWRAWLVVPAGVGAVIVALVAATTTTPATAGIPTIGIGTNGGTTTTSPGAPTFAQPVRVLLFGDSVALTLGIGLSDPAGAEQIRLRALRPGHPRLWRRRRAGGRVARFPATPTRHRATARR